MRLSRSDKQSAGQATQRKEQYGNLCKSGSAGRDRLGEGRTWGSRASNWSRWTWTPRPTTPGTFPARWASTGRRNCRTRSRRDIISKEAFEQLVGGAGISPEDTVVLYGDNNNWFAAYGFWLFKIYGHQDVRLMNGGRVKWLNEKDKPLVTEVPP